MAASDSVNAAASWGALAGAYRRAGRSDDARRAYRRAFEIRPLDGGWERQLPGDSEYVTRVQVDALERLAAGAEAGSEDVWGRLGEGYLAAGRRGDAIRALRRAFEISEKPARRDRLATLGDTAYLANWAESRPRALEAAAASSGGRDANIWGRFGDECTRAGRLDDALRAYRRAQEIEPAESMWRLKAHTVEGFIEAQSGTHHANNPDERDVN